MVKNPKSGLDPEWTGVNNEKHENKRSNSETTDISSNKNPRKLRKNKGIKIKNERIEIIKRKTIKTANRTPKETTYLKTITNKKWLS